MADQHIESKPVEIEVCLCDIIEKDAIITQRPDGEKLDKQWESLPQISKKAMKKETKEKNERRKAVGEMRGNMSKFYNALFLPGQGRTLKSPAEMSKDLFVRDAENLANFDGIKSAGATFVPQNYLPKNKQICDTGC